MIIRENKIEEANDRFANIAAAGVVLRCQAQPYYATIEMTCRINNIQSTTQFVFDGNQWLATYEGITGHELHQIKGSGCRENPNFGFILTDDETIRDLNELSKYNI